MNNQNNSKLDFFTLMNSLGEANICPFYYFNGIINQGSADIIICTYKDFFDLKTRIKISNLIPQEERNNYKLIFDECGDIDYIMQDYFSMNIDDNLLQYTSDNLFILREKYTSSENERITENENKAFLKMDVEQTHNGLVHETEKKQTHIPSEERGILVENEFLEFNGFSRIFFGILIKENI